MKSEAMEKPVADQSANNANSHVADETETAAPYNLARQPSGNAPTTKMIINPSPDRCMRSISPSL